MGGGEGKPSRAGHKEVTARPPSGDIRRRGKKKMKVPRRAGRAHELFICGRGQSEERESSEAQHSSTWLERGVGGSKRKAGNLKDVFQRRVKRARN